MSPASAASSVAAAARLLASRWKPSNRSRLSPSEPEYDVFEGTVTICPVAALYRLVDARVEEPLAGIAGKNAPAGQRSSAPAGRTPPRARAIGGRPVSAPPPPPPPRPRRCARRPARGLRLPAALG